MGRMRGKMGTKWTVLLREDWTKMGMRVEGKEKWSYKYTATNI